MTKVAVVGVGFVGSTAAYAMMIEGVAEEIVLVDISKQKAEGEAMDLEQGMQFMPSCKVEYSDKFSACKGADVVVICAGAHQKPGETRLDLVKKNASIFKGMISSIVKHNKDCVFLIVSNPVDILTYLTIKYSKFPPNRVVGSGTTLDTARFRYMLGQYFKVDPHSIHAYVLGEHGDSEFPAWSTANVGGVDLKRMPRYNKKAMDGIFKKTRNSAYEIIAKKGATYYAIGVGISDLVRAILTDQNRVMPVSNLLKGYHGVSDVCLSTPCVLGKEGIKQKLMLPLDGKEKKALQRSAKVLKSYIKQT